MPDSRLLATCPTCGSTCSYKPDLKRFTKRHLGEGSSCAKKKAFNQRLASGVTSVEDVPIDEESMDLYVRSCVPALAEKIESQLLDLYSEFLKDRTID